MKRVIGDAINGETLQHFQALVRMNTTDPPGGERPAAEYLEQVLDEAGIPAMSTGATDMAYLRGRGMQCDGVGPAIDTEDGPKGFGAHSDQERILESELHRFVRFHYEAVADLAGAK